MRRKFYGAVATASALTLLGGGVAVADTVTNNVTAGGNDTITAGGSTSVNYKINIENQRLDGQNGCNAADLTPATLTINAPTGVTVSPSSRLYTSCGTDQAFSFSSQNAGTYTITASVADSGTGTYTTTAATWTLRVNAATVVTPADTTEPVLTLPSDITAEATGASGAPVTYTATATDNVDGAITPSCSPASGSTFALGTTAAPFTTVNCSASDAAGNTATGSFKVTVQDTTAPALTSTSMPTNSTVEATSADGAVVTYTSPTATDAVTANPAVTCLPASGSTFALGDTTVSCTAKDAANNTSAASTFEVKVQDTTAPSLSNVPGNQTAVAISSGGAVVEYTSPTATDAVTANPTVTCLPASGSTFALGTTTVSCTAKDAANNTSAASTFKVTVQYDSSKVLQPINENGSSKFKLNSTVPVKIKLSGASAGIDNAVITQGVSKLTNNVWGTDEEAPSTATPHSGNTLRYDAASDQYIFNLATKPLSTGTFRVTLNLGGGKTETAEFSIVK